MIQIKVGEVRAGIRGMRITGKIREIGEPKEIGTRYGRANLATAILEDETGSIRLNLWRDQIDVAKAGDTVVIENAFAREFSGVLEVNIGADGRIAVLERG
jgi:ssDNA-binding replication factor A large subunit